MRAAILGGVFDQALDKISILDKWPVESRNIQYRSMEHIYDISKNTKVLPEMRHVQSG
jgi:hypothetical protein